LIFEKLMQIFSYWSCVIWLQNKITVSTANICIHFDNYVTFPDSQIDFNICSMANTYLTFRRMKILLIWFSEYSCKFQKYGLKFFEKIVTEILQKIAKADCYPMLVYGTCALQSYVNVRLRLLLFHSTRSNRVNS